MRSIIAAVLLFAAVFSCSDQDRFQWHVDRFADLQVLRYRAPGFEKLPLKQKKLLYYLSEAALSGRDIFYDQNNENNLTVRRALEAIVRGFAGDRSTGEFQDFMAYTKRVWFSNGIHHHYSTDKIIPKFSLEYFKQLVLNSPAADFPLQKDEKIENLLERLAPIIFDPAVAAKRVNQSPQADQVLRSANNYYRGLTQKEVEIYYQQKIDKEDSTPISYGLNSQLVRENGEISERIWKLDSMYGAAIKKIVFWLEKAVTVAENDKQKLALDKLIEFYRTGDLQKFDEFSIAWVQDDASNTYFINGFNETYGDPLGYRGAFGALVAFVDPVATKRIHAIGAQAQWFENNSPIMTAHKKSNVRGISANVITVVAGAGDLQPDFPIGINLPNSNWIRAHYGSKSVNLGNIIDASNQASRSSNFLAEFGYSATQNKLERKYGVLADNLGTDMHEVIGHASGKLADGIATPKETLKSYSNTIEEARAELVALYYLLDPKLVDIDVMPSLDVGKAEYISFIRNGLLWQLRRLEPGARLESAHMRSRQMISKWCFEKGAPESIIERKTRDGKTFFVINDFEKLRNLFGQLLREVQRIKSEGDYDSAKALTETYGTEVDAELHKEVLERSKKLDSAPYTGYVNPRLVPVMQGDEITDVKIEYPDNFVDQMLEYAEKYSFLPHYN